MGHLGKRKEAKSEDELHPAVIVTFYSVTKLVGKFPDVQHRIPKEIKTKQIAEPL